MSIIVYNAIQTPDGTIIQSKHRHDYVVHKDANGKQYMVDGGLDYFRRSAVGGEKNISLTVFDNFEKIREVVTWGRNYDKDMNRLPSTQWVPIKDLNDDHLDALCLYERADWRFRILFIKEKQYRNITLENIY